MFKSHPSRVPSFTWCRPIFFSQPVSNTSWRETKDFFINLGTIKRNLSLWLNFFVPIWITNDSGKICKQPSQPGSSISDILLSLLNDDSPFSNWSLKRPTLGPSSLSCSSFSFGEPYKQIDGLVIFSKWGSTQFFALSPNPLGLAFPPTTLDHFIKLFPVVLLWRVNIRTQKFALFWLQNNLCGGKIPHTIK